MYDIKIFQKHVVIKAIHHLKVLLMKIDFKDSRDVSEI